MKKFCRMFIVLVALVISMSCMSAMNVSAAQKVKLNKKKVTIYVGKTTTLKLKNNKKKIKWSTSNKKVATVSKKGKVKGKKAGKATITAKVGEKKYKCKVTVKKPKNQKKSQTARDKVINACIKYGELSMESNSKCYSLYTQTYYNDKPWMEYYTYIFYYPQSDRLVLCKLSVNTSKNIDWITTIMLEEGNDDTCDVLYKDIYGYNVNGVVYKKLIHLDDAVDFYNADLMEDIFDAEVDATTDIWSALKNFDYLMRKYSVGVNAKDFGFTTVYSVY